MFNIHVNNNEVGKFQIKKEIAKISARELLENKYKLEENALKDPWKSRRINRKDAQKNLKIFKRDYERVSPETLSNQTVNFMWKRAKQLKDEFTAGMLSREELHPVKQFLVDGTMIAVVDEERMRTNRSVERELIWLKHNEDKIKEFKNIMRHLDPQNPCPGNIEKYRPKGRGIR